MSEPLGIVINSTTVDKLEFIASRSVKIGEFVTFDTDDGSTLGFVKDSIIESILFNKDEIKNYQAAKEARDLKINNQRDKSRMAFVNVLGLVEPFKNGLKVMPSLPPEPGTNIYEADKDTLNEIFRKNSKEWVKIGNLLRMPSIDVYVNVNQIVSRHLAILATTGSGKSNLLALLIKKIADLNGTVILFDYHGEYSELDIKNVKHMIPKINPRKLELEEFADMIDIKEHASRQRGILTEAFKDAKDSNDFWDTLFKAIESIALTKRGEERYVADRVLEIVQNSRERLKNILDPEIEGLDQLEEHKINIFNMLELNERQASILVAYYAKEILVDRRSAKKKKFKSPLLIALEEAHAFIPTGEHNKTSEVMAKIAREGRKFGVGLVIISQRPSKIDQNVLSQMNSLAISRIIQPKDQNYIMDIIESIPSELLKHLPSLNTGEVLLTGRWVTIPSLVKVDKVEEKISGTDINAVKEWDDSIDTLKKGERTSDLIIRPDNE
jgi:hypothetical protein